MIPTGSIGQFDELQRFDKKPAGLPQEIWDAVENRDFCEFLVTLQETRRMKYAREPRENDYEETRSRVRGILLDDLVSLLSREPGRFEISDAGGGVKNRQTNG